MPRQQEKNRPAHEVRYGHVKAVIWRNETPNGHMYNVTVARLFKDGDEWKASSSFGHDDLLVLAKALNDAHTWIQLQKDSERESQREAAAAA
jgi:hypothetical protein